MPAPQFNSNSAHLLPIVEPPPAGYIAPRGPYIDHVGSLAARRNFVLTTDHRPLTTSAPLPMTRAEMRARGWDAVDIVFVTGDAYVDHPSFAMALLGRLLEDEGFRVAMLSQPDWHSCQPWRTFGKPRLFFAISAGNMDSMINHYTANRKVRNDDAYSPGGRIGRRPDRATLAYCQRAREAYKGVPIIAGGVEASLRRLAHYDYWSDKVRRSIVLDAKCDLLVYGMGERPIIEIAHRLAAGATVKDLRNLRGVAYRLGAKESLSYWEGEAPAEPPAYFIPGESPGANCPTIRLPDYESISGQDLESKKRFCTLTKISHQETNPHNAKRLVQYHGPEAVVINPGALPLTQAEMDRVYGLPFTRLPHPSYGGEKIPAYDVVKHSVQIMRGCFGGCTFCSITAHEGRIIQSRSQESVLAEIDRMRQTQADFTGVVSDIGGPTANMYQMKCSRPEVEAVCRRLSCVHPTICKLLGTDHGPLVQLMQKSRAIPGVKKVLVASGIRMDLARRDPVYMRELAQHHVGGYLKVAPEHTDPGVLGLMKKPSNDDFEEFAKKFTKQSKVAGKQQYLIPYYIASHPGSDLNAMIDLALFLKRNHYRPDQVQDFIPSPFDIAACMYHTGYDPFTMQPVYIAKHLRDRRLQRALLQFFKPENYFEVRQALEKAGRQDLIGSGCDCLIPDRPPKEALSRRRRKANERLNDVSGDHIRGAKQLTNKTGPIAPGSTGGSAASGATGSASASTPGSAVPTPSLPARREEGRGEGSNQARLPQGNRAQDGSASVPLAPGSARGSSSRKKKTAAANQKNKGVGYRPGRRIKRRK